MGDQKSDVLDFSGTINTSYTEIKEKSKKEGLKRRKIVSVSSFKILKELIAQSLGSNNISLTRNNILFAESPQSLLRAFCEVTINPKQKAMIIQPTLSDYSRAIKEVGGVVVNSMRKRENDFSLPLEEIKQTLTSEIKAIFICNPNDPTGTTDSSRNLQNLLSIASESSAPVLIDERYVDFVQTTISFPNLFKKSNNIFSLRSFKYFYGLKECDFSYLIGNKDKLKLIEISGELTSLNQINGIKENNKNLKKCLQKIANCLKNEQLKASIRQFFRNQRNKLLDNIEMLFGFNPYPSEVNFVLIDSEELGLTGKQIETQLLKKGIKIHECGAYNGLGAPYFRVAVKEWEKNTVLCDALYEIINIGKMNPKGIKLINQAIESGEQSGLIKDCPYFPCHKGLEDCTFCYCPFYPCKDPRTGGKYTKPTHDEKKVWDCTDCILPHKKENSRKILEALIGCKKPFEDISGEKLMKIHDRIVEEDDEY